MKGDGAVEDMKREAKGLAVQTLGKDDRLRRTIWEVLADERGRAGAGVRFPGHLAIYVDNLRSICSIRISLLFNLLRRVACSPCEGRKKMADTVMTSGTAGGGVCMTTWCEGGGGATKHSLR